MGQHIIMVRKTYRMMIQLSLLFSGTLSIGFIGLAECLTALTGQTPWRESEAQKFRLEYCQIICGKRRQVFKRI